MSIHLRRCLEFIEAGCNRFKLIVWAFQEDLGVTPLVTVNGASWLLEGDENGKLVDSHGREVFNFESQNAVLDICAATNSHPTGELLGYARLLILQC